MTGDNGNSIGLWQINVPSHPEYDTNQLTDPAHNAGAACQISSNGKNWQPWSAYKNGAYKSYIQEAKGALEDQNCNWSGTWSTDWGKMVLHQSGYEVSGDYTHNQGKIVGTVSGNKLIGTWSEAPSYSPTHDAGDVELTLSDDCKSFSGNWRYGSEWGWSGGWIGTRA